MSQEHNPVEHNELAALTQALKHSLERRRRLGVRRAGQGLPQPAPQAKIQAMEPAPGAPAPPATASTAPLAAPVAPQKAPTPQSQASMAAACPDLEHLALASAKCQACGLHTGRQQPVFGEGRPEQGGILFMGESPGPEDNASGSPFSGPAGQLLTDIIVKGMGLSRQQVYITSLVKCPSPAGRAPSPEEVSMCSPILQRQLELVAPGVLVPLGAGPANFLLGTNSTLPELRDQLFERHGRRIVPTHHPAQLLQEPAKKRECWADIQRAMAAAGIKKGS